MLKKIAAVLGACAIFSSGVYAYSFPEPDWGQLLKEKRAMENEIDFELYTQGDKSSAPFYGARLEPSDGVYLGMIAETSGNFKPIGAYLTYIDDMYQEDLYYPANAMIRNDNVITMVGWTINDINSIDFDKVRSVLDTLNSYNKPMFIRFANEMNVSALGDEPEAYVNAFRRVADMVHEYPNFAVVWSPNDLGALDRPFEYYYPGDEYTDWIGVSCYSIRYFQGSRDTEEKSAAYFMTGDYAWATNRVKPIMEFMQKYGINKPVMISEGGVATSNWFGEDMQDWAEPRLGNMLYNLIMKYPQIKMINYFNTHRELEAEKFDISDYPYASDIFSGAKNSGAYITSYGQPAQFSFRPASEGQTLTAQAGNINVYTLAHFPGYPDVAVNYFIDGNWYGVSDTRPYKCSINVNDIADGQHTMKISAYSSEKSYPFYKKGNIIRFMYEPEESDISVTLNGDIISFDQPPVIENGRTLVPLRAIFEALEAQVEWDGGSKTITASKNGVNISLKIDNPDAVKNGQTITLDVPAKIINGRTLVPVRFVSDCFGVGVSWDESIRRVVLTAEN